MSRRPGLLFVLNSFEAGGAEIFAMRLAVYLKNQFSIFVVTPDQDRNDVGFRDYFIEQTGAEHLLLYPGPSRTLSWFMWKINALASLLGLDGSYVRLLGLHEMLYWRRSIRSRNILLCNSHFFRSEKFVSTRLRPAVPKLKWVVTMHSSYNEEVYTQFDFATREQFFTDVRRIFSESDHTFCVADVNKVLLANLGIRTPVEKLYLGYESKPQSGPSARIPSKEKLLFAMIGRGVAGKGWSIALRAFETVRQRHNNVGMLCIGPETEFMQSIQHEFAHVPEVYFTGYVKDTAKLIAKSDIGLLPSYGESLPYSIIEFLAQGRPVIASNRGEIPMMLNTDHGIAGAVIPDDSNGLPSVDALIELMEAYIHDPELLKAHQTLARLAFQKFSMDHCGGRYLEVFRLLMDGKA